MYLNIKFVGYLNIKFVGYHFQLFTINVHERHEHDVGKLSVIRSGKKTIIGIDIRN